MNKAFLAIVLTCSTMIGVCQKGPSRYVGEPILADSSTLFIPTRYNEEFLSSNKIAFWGDYYANLLIYNFRTDTYKKLFERDTFIESLQSMDSYRYNGPNSNVLPEQIRNFAKKWVFLLVKPTDTNNSGRTDEKDPSVVFAVSRDGQTLKKLTDEKENVVGFIRYVEQGFILIKVQKDSDNDGSFKTEDKEFAYRKISLADLSVGKSIDAR